MPILFPGDLATIDDPAVNERNQAHWLDEGWALLRDVARPLRLGDALKERRLSPEQGRRLLMGVVANVAPALRAITEALIKGATRLAGWWRSFRDTLIPGLFAGPMAMLDSDPGRLAPADLQAIQDEANRQAAFLGRFRDQIASGVQLLDGTAPARAELYGHAAWSTAMIVQRAKMIRDGLKFEKSHLGISDHCDQCIAESRKGLRPIGTLIPVGSRICLTRCHCWFTYR